MFAERHSGVPSAEELLRLTDLGGRGLSVVVAAGIREARGRRGPVDGVWGAPPPGTRPTADVICLS